MFCFFFFQILKEAKDASETAAAEASGEEPRPVIDLFSEFDKFQGVAHLEALEMLSRDSEAEVSSACTKSRRPYCTSLSWCARFDW